MNDQKLMVVTGAQYGSEGKGQVAAWLAQCHPQARCVRVGGPNAGHTVVDTYGRTHKLQHLPTGVVHGNPCLIAAGSELDLEILQREVADFQPKWLMIDEMATVMEPEHGRAESEGLPHGLGGITARIGSTGKGVGAARSERIWRRAQVVRDLSNGEGRLWLGDRRIPTGSVASHLNEEMSRGRSVIIEGTQGYGLGLHTKFYPFTTSGNARAIDFLAQAGINPWYRPEAKLEIWLTARTFPIRVAGNSGPLHGELSWDQVGQPPEHTTVTKKRRRVGRWDPMLVREAIESNGGPGAIRLALTFLDYVFPQLHEVTDPDKILSVAGAYLADRQHELGLRITAVGTGPRHMTIL